MNILLVDLVKVSVCGNLSTEMRIIIFFAYVAMFLVISTVIIYLEGKQAMVLTVIISNQSYFWLVVGYILLSISLKNLVEDAFRSFFCSPMIQQVDEYERISDMISLLGVSKTQWDSEVQLQRRVKSITKQVGVMSGRLFQNRDDCDINIQQSIVYQ